MPVAWQFPVFKWDWDEIMMEKLLIGNLFFKSMLIVSPRARNLIKT